jgi:hypothetical protein
MTLKAGIHLLVTPLTRYHSFIEMPEIGYGNFQSPQRVAVLRFNRKPEAVTKHI